MWAALSALTVSGQTVGNHDQTATTHNDDFIPFDSESEDEQEDMEQEDTEVDDMEI